MAQITIEKVTYITSAVTVNHTVTSSDISLIAFGFSIGVTSVVPTISFGGNNFSNLVSAGAVGTAVYAIQWFSNPAVGSFPVAVVAASTTPRAFILSVRGLDKRSPNIITATGGSGSLNTLTITPAQAHSLVIQISGLQGGIPTTAGYNSIITNDAFGMSLAYKIAEPSDQTIVWPGVSSVAAAVFEPNSAQSYWFPGIGTEATSDIPQANALDTPSLVAGNTIGNVGAIFWQNSFLHTIGRMHKISPPPATITSETEQETSQIIIDKIIQGQIGGGSTLNLNVPIPSQDAVLVVTGGSVIATGGAWQSVTFNGVPLKKLVQAGVAGNSAEIWYMQNPPVGMYTLSIVPTATFGEVYANAIVLLEVDKKDTNFITASATDAATTSTISASITPDAPNSLIIDCIVALDPIASPVPDASQTQMFNATALVTNETVVSTFKLGSNTATNMNYNLSASVNAALVVACFRPANHASIWFPNINSREIDDVVTVNGLDANLNSAFGSYGYKPSNFYFNSFLHTVGRLKPQPIIPLSLQGLLAGLIAYWSFHDGKGTNAYDSLNTNNLTWQGTLGDQWRTNGILGSAGNFNGVDTVASISSVVGLSTSFSLFSFGGWFSADPNQIQSFPHVVSLGADFGDEAIIYYNASIQTYAVKFKNIGGSTFDNGSVSIPPNTLTHVIGTYDGINVNVYVNGVNVVTTAESGSIFLTSSQGIIGASGLNGTQGQFKGLIGEIGLWNKALTPFEVQALYNLGRGLTYPFVPNQIAIGIQGYNPYSNYKYDNWQTSFLQTIGRIRSPQPTTTGVASTLLTLGVG